MAARWAKMASRCGQDGPSWSQDGPRWGLAGHLGASWGGILGIFGSLWGDLCQKGRSVKSNNPTTFVADFGVCGGLVASSWRPSCAILARSRAILGDFGVKLGPSWQDVGTKMPKMNQDRPTWEEKWLGCDTRCPGSAERTAEVL